MTALILYALATFGLAFFVGNKIAILHEWAKRPGWIWDKLKKFLACPYCQGFWSGWVTWGASWGMSPQPITYGILGEPWHWIGAASQGLCWAFACAAVCYYLFVAIVWLEDSPSAFAGGANK